MANQRSPPLFPIPMTAVTTKMLQKQQARDSAERIPRTIRAAVSSPRVGKWSRTPMSERIIGTICAAMRRGPGFAAFRFYAFSSACLLPKSIRDHCGLKAG